MNLLQLTIETFDKNVETDFTSFKNHINYIEDHNTVINGLTFAFFGLTEIIIKRVYLTFELNNIIHTIERVYQSGRCILRCDDLENEEAQHLVHNILNMNYNQFLHQFIMPSSFIETWIQSPTEALMRSFVSTKPVMTSDTKMIEEQINDTMAFLNSYEDYNATGSQQKTDLNIALSKKFLNDRLTITVGKNFGLEGQDAASKTNTSAASSYVPDFTASYQLTKDGRYLIKGYRKNAYEAILDGYVIETGVSFVVTLDYEKFRDIFRKRKNKQATEIKEPAKDN